MAGRGLESFKQMQREMQQREKHQERLAKRLQRKREKRITPPAAPVRSETK